MLTIKKLKSIQCFEDVETLELGNPVYSLGDRGGYFGFYGSAIAENLKIKESDLPAKYGVYCNYLGGGVRGAITGSGYNKAIPKRKARLLDELANACRRVYESLEAEIDADDPTNVEPNWDALATKMARKAGIVSAY